MQDMHAHGVDTHKLAARMAELQQAHAMQNEHVSRLEAAAASTPKLESTISKQGALIRALEELLRKAVEELRTAKKGGPAVQPVQLPSISKRSRRPPARLPVVPENAGISGVCVEEARRQAQEVAELRAAKVAAEREVVDAVARVEQRCAVRLAQACPPLPTVFHSADSLGSATLCCAVQLPRESAETAQGVRGNCTGGSSDNFEVVP